jgi:hypothetical protein
LPEGSGAERPRFDYLVSVKIALSALPVLLLAACGGSDNPKVEVCAVGQTLLGYRAGSGPWQAAPAPVNGRHVLPVDGDYEFVTVTAYAGGASTYYYAGTAAETLPIDDCGEDRTVPPVHVTAQLPDSDTELSVDGNTMSGPTVDLDITPGTHDVLVTNATLSANADPRVLLQRDVVFDAAKDLGALDPATGIKLESVPVTVAQGPAGLSTTVYLQLNVNDFAEASRSDTSTAQVVPQSALRSGDEQDIYVFGGSGAIVVKYKRTAPSVTWPAAVTGVTFTGTTAAWTTLPEPYTGVYTYSFSSDFSKFQYASATKGWLDAHQQKTLAFPTDVPGFMASWTVTDGSGPQFAVWNDDGDVSTYSYAGSGAARVAPARRLLPRAGIAGMR